MNINIPFYLPKLFLNIWDWLFLTFDKNGVVQLISSIFVLIGAYIAFMSTKRKTSIDLITKNRIDWTNLVREKASEIIFLAHKTADLLNIAFKNKKNPEKAIKAPNEHKEFADNLYRLNGLIIEFKLYFNPFDKNDKVVLDILDKLDRKFDDYNRIENYPEIIELIKEFSQQLSYILKSEWEKIKCEAGINPNRYTIK